jgi:hypothetical protein
MAGTWSLLKKIGLKKYDELSDSFQSKDAPRKKTGPRIDKDLPLGLRINAIVDVPQVDFILGGDALKIKYPGSGSIVVSYGTFPMGKSMVHRFYLGSTEHVYMLQVVTDQKKAVEECKLFMSYDELYPEDWDFWLSERDGYIGLDLFQTKDGARYDRVWQNPDARVIVEQDEHGNQLARIPPVEILETVYADPYGEQTETVKYDSMLYGRHLNDSVDEYLLVSAVSEKDGASVQIMTGIPLEPTTIKVI